MDLTHKLGEAGKQALAVKLPEEAVKHSATPEATPPPAEHKDEHQDEHKTEHKAEATDGHGQGDKPKDKVDWTNVGGVFIGVNIIVIGLIMMIVIMIKKRRAKKGTAKTEEEVDTQL